MRAMATGEASCVRRWRQGGRQARIRVTLRGAGRRSPGLFRAIRAFSDMSTHLLAIDQGTTGSTALVMGSAGRTLGRATLEFPQHFPEPGWVEHEPEEIWGSV